MENSAKNIIIVEDDSVQQIMLERLVTKMGHTVLAKVSDGSKAIKSALRLKTVDLILMDIRLRDEIDGIQAMDTIRKETDVKVIYITSNTDDINLERAKQGGFVDFIAKPIDPKRLTQAFEKAFELAH